MTPKQDYTRSLGIVAALYHTLEHETIEALASVQHDEIWAHWMRYQFSICEVLPDGSLRIPAEKVERWTRQMNTPYDDLTEKEKESDREQAYKVLTMLATVLAALLPTR